MRGGVKAAKLMGLSVNLQGDRSGVSPYKFQPPDELSKNRQIRWVRPKLMRRREEAGLFCTSAKIPGDWSSWRRSTLPSPERGPLV